jgi:Fe-S cluster biosynthesis and repair protein YggX
MAEITCVRCGETKPAFERPPFPGGVGQRVVAEICPDCWQLWTRQQMMLINHYGLNLMDPQARTFLTKQMEAFLFGSGKQEGVDTSKEGSIEW